MYKKILNLALITIIMASMLVSCQSSAEKEKAAQQKKEKEKIELEKTLQEAKDKANREAIAAEWASFKISTEIKIAENEATIAELKLKMKKSGKTLDKLYEKKIDMLEEQNKNLKSRLNSFETKNSDWESFKREFNHDMDELGKALKDLTVDNKN